MSHAILLYPEPFDPSDYERPARHEPDTLEQAVRRFLHVDESLIETMYVAPRPTPPVPTFSIRRVRR